MQPKTVIITGANSGIGKAAAHRFAREGCTVLMACRNLEKGAAAQRELIAATGNHRVDLLELDVSSFASIRRFSAAFKEKYGALDILIHNAAYLNHGETNYRLSADGIELSFATNLAGPFLMTRLMREHLRMAREARVLTACTTNIRHFFDPKRGIEFDNLLGEFKDSRPFSAYKMYGDSKMALLLLTFKMAEVCAADSIQINAVQIPAIKLSPETMRNFKSGYRLAARIQNLFSDSQESMGDTYFHLCTAEEFAGVSGKLFNAKREIMQPSHYGDSVVQAVKQLFDQKVYPRYAQDPANLEKVWALCTRLAAYESVSTG